MKLSALTDRYRELKRKALSNGRIRTYNYKQGVVKDHRTGKKADLKKVLNGGIELLM